MTAMGWNEAAALMNDWFSRPPGTAPAKVTPNTTAVTMGWTLGFARAKSVYDAIVSDRTWVNSKAQEIIKSQIDNIGLPTIGSTKSFGMTAGAAAHAIHPDHVNHRSVSQSLSDPLDGLSGALANFSYYVAVSGTVTDVKESPWYSLGTKRSYRVNIVKVGIYLRDSYDFNDFQLLGCWDPVANTVSRVGLGKNSHCVTNATFREWRTANGHGGDFLVFSDINVLSATDSFDYNK